MIRSSSIEASIDALIEKVGRKLVIAIPLAIGKPNVWINAVYQRARRDPSLELTIFTGLSLDRPQGRSLIERRFLEPFAERVFGDYPDLDYARDARRNALPPNVRLNEFFLKSGTDLGIATMQHNFVYTSYTHAVRDALVSGVNVYAQAVAIDEVQGLRLSMSCNSDLTRDVLDMANGDGTQRLHLVGVVNRTMPFMENDAVLAPEEIDILVDDPAATHDMFAPPNQHIDDQDYAIALWSSTLVKDGGMLQIGIGSLGDGIAQALIQRDQANDRYRTMIADLAPAGLAADAELQPFAEGLYGCSEMLVNGFMALIDTGIVRREVFDDLVLQRLLNERRIGLVPDEAMLVALLEARRVGATLSAEDVDFLRRFGIFKDDVQWCDGRLDRAGQQFSAHIGDASVRRQISQHLLGTRLQGGCFMHGGFFIGPKAFYQRLRELPAEVMGKISMTRISFINELFGHEDVGREQRRDARFINTTMMATLLGDAISDGLDDGNIVSGVGGQYNFVAQAHQLPTARSILMLRSWRRDKAGRVVSNIVWRYGHTTIPRFLRDIYVTEYGIADVRGMPDAEIIKRMLAITDSRFQAKLLADAQRAGKIEADYQIPAAFRNNTPEALARRLASYRREGTLPDYPFGTDFTPEDLVAVKALSRLKACKASRWSMLRTIVRGFFRQADPVVLRRLGLESAATFEEYVLRLLIRGI